MKSKILKIILTHKIMKFKLFILLDPFSFKDLP